MNSHPVRFIIIVQLVLSLHNLVPLAIWAQRLVQVQWLIVQYVLPVFIVLTILQTVLPLYRAQKVSYVPREVLLILLVCLAIIVRLKLEILFLVLRALTVLYQHQLLLIAPLATTALH